MVGKRAIVGRRAIETSAVLLDGEWYEKKYDRDPAENERNLNEWSKEFQELFDKMPDDAVLTMVDCYIN
jgi:hypothetical protein